MTETDTPTGESPLTETGSPSSAGEARLGIAFGAGAAKGWAHIGVIKRLTEAGIVPDVVAGTSIGALCGGCYVADKLDELEAFARALTRRRIFGLMDLSWRGSGLISGNKLAKMLAEEINEIQIEDLPRPFICIATELLTGHEIWLKEGHLATAVRASYALPGVFKPVFFNNMWLLDGAVVNPIPVSVCRAMGARVVIAVNLNTESFGGGTVIQTPLANGNGSNGDSEADKADTAEEARTAFMHQLFGGSEGPGITTVLVAAFNISQDRLARSRLAGDPPDAIISVKCPGVGLFDFDKASESIDAGWEAADRALPDIANAISHLRIGG
jgi:NTE family protein